MKVQWNLGIVVFKGHAILSHYNKRPLFRNNGLNHYSEILAQTTKAKCPLRNEVLISDRILSLGLMQLKLNHNFSQASNGGAEKHFLISQINSVTELVAYSSPGRCNL